MAADIDYVRINKKSHAKKTVGNIFLYLVLTLWAVIVLFPFYWMVVTSIKGYGAYNSEKYQVLLQRRLRWRTTKMYSHQCLF